MTKTEECHELRAELDAMSKRLSEAEAAELQWLTYRHVVDRVEDLEKQLAACQKDAAIDAAMKGDV